MNNEEVGKKVNKKRKKGKGPLTITNPFMKIQKKKLTNVTFVSNLDISRRTTQNRKFGLKKKVRIMLMHVLSQI